MTTINEEGKYTISLSMEVQPAQVYLCEDLKQVKRPDSSYDIKKKSDNTVVGNTAMELPDIDVELV